MQRSDESSVWYCQEDYSLLSLSYIGLSVCAR